MKICKTMIRKLIYLLSVALVILGGCRADDDMRRVEPPTSKDGTTLQLLIPSTSMARETGARRGASLTRAENHGTASTAESEGAINSLHLIGFYYDAEAGNAKKHFYLKLDPQAADNQVEGIYNCYNLDIEDGDYHLYLLANIDISALETYGLNDSDADASALETAVNGLTILGESDLNAAHLDYTRPGKGLPMVWKDNISIKKGIINKATANLEFCVAKVRLTLLFDNTDFSAGYGSDTELKISATDALNVYAPTRIFKPESIGDNYSGNKEKIETIGTGGHYELPASCDPEDLVKTDYSLDNLTPKEAPAGQIAYQVTCYLPECEAARLGESMPGTSLVAMPEGESIEQIEIPLGCKSPESKDLIRGHYYDIVGRMNSARQVELIWNILPWTVESLAVQLSGDTELNLGETVIESLEGSETRKIAYSTTAPRVTFESDKDEESGKPIFILSANAADNVINLQVNPELGVRTGDNSKLTGKGFYVVAGNIRKRVDVKEVDLSAFLRLLPESQTLYAKQIANQASYDMYIDYATNMSSLTLILTDYSNGNAKPTASTPANDADLKFYATICGADSVAVSKPIRLAKEKELSMSSLLLADTKSLPKGGFIRISVIDPIDQEYFGKSIHGTVTATATEGSQTLTKTSDFTIIPSAQFYTIHFKAINGETWNAPHAYIYQNLEYDGRQVMKKNKDGNWELNYVEYNFSCGHSFKGWKPWGACDIPEYVGKKYWKDENQETYECDWGEESAGAGGRYDTGVDFFHDYRVDATRNRCEACRNAIPEGYPGIMMEKEEEDGWWKLELPLIAKPGKTLIMFNDGHSASSSRYPGSQIPGIVLPNYGDCEAWFLLDRKQGESWTSAGESCYFTDDRNDSYPAKPEPVTKTVTLRYKSSIPQTQIHLFESEQHKLTIWNKGNTELKDGYRYLKLEVKESDCATLNNLDGTFKFIIYNNDQDRYTLNGKNQFNFNNDNSAESGKVKKLDSSSMPSGYQSDYCFELFGETTTDPDPEYTYKVFGDLGTSGTWKAFDLTKNADGTWTGTVNVTNIGSFGIQALLNNEQKQWIYSNSTTNYSISASGEYQGVVQGTGTGNNWSLSGTPTGVYTFTFNPKTLKLTVTVPVSTVTKIGFRWHPVAGGKTLSTWGSGWTTDGVTGTPKDGFYIATYEIRGVTSPTITGFSWGNNINYTSTNNYRKASAADAAKYDCDILYDIRKETGLSSDRNAIFWCNPVSGTSNKYLGIYLFGGTFHTGAWNGNPNADDLFGDKKYIYKTISGLTISNGGKFILNCALSGGSSSQTGDLDFNTTNLTDRSSTLGWFVGANSVIEVTKVDK